MTPNSSFFSLNRFVRVSIFRQACVSNTMAPCCSAWRPVSEYNDPRCNKEWRKESVWWGNVERLHLYNIAKMTVIPAEAGIQKRRSSQKYWIPAPRSGRGQASREWRVPDTIFYAWHDSSSIEIPVYNTGTKEDIDNCANWQERAEGNSEF